MPDLHEFVVALLDCLLPGDGRWPAASGTTAPSELISRIDQDAALAAAFSRARAALPIGFIAYDRAAQVYALQRVEQEEPAVFAAILTEAFAAYYMDDAVMRHLGDSIGYPASPPQPDGRALPPFDLSLVPRVAPAADDIKGA